ncbi:MAG TPA: cytochrome P450 [Solirubrobacteraceae bacterium]|nr:cytochrome P450 [Solirubrobacteraceae bacterium]
MSPLPPGPSEPPLIQTLRWIARPIAFMESCRRRYGDAFSVSFVGFQRPMVMLGDPEAIRALYTESANGLPPGRKLSLLPILGADSVLLLEGREHLARRRLMLPPFHGERMRSYETIVREAVQRELAGWREGEELAIHPRMQAITLEVILRAVFGVTDPQRRAQLSERLPALLDGTASVGLQLRMLLAPRLTRADPLKEMKRQLVGIDELLFAEIAERRAEGDSSGREDILSLLMAARFEDGSAMADRDLRDQLLTLLLAGHETTATALAWTFDLLLRSPAALARLTAEVDAGEDDEYLRAVISESLRLRPVVPLAGRRLASELEVGGLTLPPGTDVTPSIWLTHTRADLYPQPYAFRPERFLQSAPQTYGWIPFGGGVRRCLGAAFAELEMRVVLETVLRERALAPVSARAERVTRRNVTFSPRHGTRVRASARVAQPRRAPEPVAA